MDRAIHGGDRPDHGGFGKVLLDMGARRPGRCDPHRRVEQVGQAAGKAIRGAKVADTDRRARRWLGNPACRCTGPASPSPRLPATRCRTFRAATAGRRRRRRDKGPACCRGADRAETGRALPTARCPRRPRRPCPASRPPAMTSMASLQWQTFGERAQQDIDPFVEAADGGAAQDDGAVAAAGQTGCARRCLVAGAKAGRYR